MISLSNIKTFSPERLKEKRESGESSGRSGNKKKRRRAEYRRSAPPKLMVHADPRLKILVSCSPFVRSSHSLPLVSAFLLSSASIYTSPTLSLSLPLVSAFFLSSASIYIPLILSLIPLSLSVPAVPIGPVALVFFTSDSRYPGSTILYPSVTPSPRPPPRLFSSARRASSRSAAVPSSFFH